MILNHSHENVCANAICFSEKCERTGLNRLVYNCCRARYHNHADLNMAQLDINDQYLQYLNRFANINPNSNDDVDQELQNLRTKMNNIKTLIISRVDEIQKNILAMQETIKSYFNESTVKQKINRITRGQCTDQQIDLIVNTIKMFTRKQSSLRDFQRFRPIMLSICDKLGKKTTQASQKIQNILQDLRQDYERYNVFNGKIKWEQFREQLPSQHVPRQQTLIQLAEQYQWEDILQSNKKSIFCLQGKIDRLKTLKITHKLLDVIPPQFSQLRGLTHLILNDNIISQIQQLDQFTHLKALCLNSNYITKIKNLDELRQLSNLQLNDNKISKIQGLSNLQYLETLQLKYNRIEKIENLQHVQRLQLLNLQSNEIRKIENLQSLDEIKKLILSNPFIKTRKQQNQDHERMGRLRTLTSLSLSLNSIEIIQEVENMELLEILGIYQNPLLKQNEQIISMLRQRKCRVQL